MCDLRSNANKFDSLGELRSLVFSMLKSLADASGCDCWCGADNLGMDAAEKNLTMQDPLAYFITWPTYGTWLPGNQRGWIEYRQGWQLPNANLLTMSKARMDEKQCLLIPVAREIVKQQIEETCRFRGWILHAVACQSNHLHVVVEAFETDPRKVRADLKAWCTRRLKAKIDGTRKNWWAERGSTRYIWNQESLDRVLVYVLESQQRKHLDH